MAVFNPIPTFPISGEGVDTTQVIRMTWDFVSNNEETQTSYRVQIYNITNTGSVVHDSGVVTSTDEFYDLPASTLANGNDYVWRVTIVGDGQTRTNTQFAHFRSLATATLTIDTIGSVGQFKTFTATYSQAQNVGVRTFQWILYDNNDVILETGQVRFGEPIEETFTGFDNNTTYKIDVRVVNQNNVTVISTRETFTTSFTIPQDSPGITVEPKPANSAIQVDWSNVINLIGQVVGTFEYVDGKFNRSLKLTDACLNADLNTRPIQQNFTISFWIKLDATHDGNFFELRKNGTNEYEVGYDRTRKRFYYKRDYREIYSSPIYELPDDFLFCGISSDTLYIKTLWQNTWQEISLTTQGLNWNQLYTDKQTWQVARTWNSLPSQRWIDFTQTYNRWEELTSNQFKLVVK